MAVASEQMHQIIRTAYRPGPGGRVPPQQAASGPVNIGRIVRAGLFDSLEVGAQESVAEIEAAGRGRNADSAADVVVAGLDLLHFGAPQRVADELLRTCRPGGRIGLACPRPGSFLAGIHGRIEAYTVPDGCGQRRGFTGARQALDALFGASATALGARDRSVTLTFASVGDWLAEWQASHAPLRSACEHVDPEWRGQFTADLLRIAGSYAEMNDGKLSIRCDYLEFIVHKGNLQ